MDYSSKLKEYINSNGLKAQLLEFNESSHTVEDAAKAVNCTPEEIVKNICMVGETDKLIVAIAKGEDRVSRSRVGKALDIKRPRLADADEILQKTGYPIGGVPSFGFDAIFLIDPKVTELDYVYSGGGTPNSLVKINVNELLEINDGTVVRIRK